MTNEPALCSDLKRCHRRSSFGFRPKVLNFTEDAHIKNMSTFATDEHLQGRGPKAESPAGNATWWRHGGYGLLVTAVRYFEKAVSERGGLLFCPRMQASQALERATLANLSYAAGALGTSGSSNSTSSRSLRLEQICSQKFSPALGGYARRKTCVPLQSRIRFARAGRGARRDGLNNHTKSAFPHPSNCRT
jgi:hypothetical protein